MVKNGTFASPAMARASSVLPVPGGPTSSTPLGILPPRRWNFCGSFRNSTISCSSPLASSMPATSSNVTRPCFSVSMRARDLPKPMARPPPACIWRMKNTQTPISSSIGNQRQQVVQQRVDVAVLGLGDDAHALVGQRLHQRRIFRRVGLEGAAVGQLAGDGAALDHHVAHPAGVHLAR